MLGFGAEGIVVSHYGGHRLDAAPATAAERVTLAPRIGGVPKLYNLQPP